MQSQLPKEKLQNSLTKLNKIRNLSLLVKHSNTLAYIIDEVIVIFNQNTLQLNAEIENIKKIIKADFDYRKEQESSLSTVLSVDDYTKLDENIKTAYKPNLTVTQQHTQEFSYKITGYTLDLVLKNYTKRHTKYKELDVVVSKHTNINSLILTLNNYKNKLNNLSSNCIDLKPNTIGFDPNTINFGSECFKTVLDNLGTTDVSPELELNAIKKLNEHYKTLINYFNTALVNTTSSKDDPKESYKLYEQLRNFYEKSVVVVSGGKPLKRKTNRKKKNVKRNKTNRRR